MDIIGERVKIRRIWSDISEIYSVPKTLYDHQMDTISLILNGDHVFVGSPTGSGKTLAQLATVLFTEGTALIIPPLVTIEAQMVGVCDTWGIKHLNLASISVKSIARYIEAEKPQILIASIEMISNVDVQKELSSLSLDYIALDEAQVLDPETGWTMIRPYSQETWAYLRARFKAPFLLLSATMDEKSLSRIAANLDLPRDSIKVLFKNPDRKNIYQLRNILKHPVDIMNLRKALGFLLPTLFDQSFKKCQVFCSSRYTTDIVAAWLKEQLLKIGRHVPISLVQVEKLTGNNTRVEKERVMDLFREGHCQVLVCTDVAGMGVDIRDLNFSINIGIPRSSWKMKQQSGRIGRDGEPSLDITLIFPQKGSAAPEPTLRKAMRGQDCIRSALNNQFEIANPLVDYSEDPTTVNCEDAGCELLQFCQCSSCQCCTVCSDRCPCPKSSKDPITVMERILSFGDDNYKKVQEFMSKQVDSDDDTEEDEEDTEEDGEVAEEG